MPVYNTGHRNVYLRRRSQTCTEKRKVLYVIKFSQNLALRVVYYSSFFSQPFSAKHKNPPRFQDFLSDKHQKPPTFKCASCCVSPESSYLHSKRDTWGQLKKLLHLQFTSVAIVFNL